MLVRRTCQTCVQSCSTQNNLALWCLLNVRLSLSLQVTSSRWDHWSLSACLMCGWQSSPPGRLTSSTSCQWEWWPLDVQVLLITMLVATYLSICLSINQSLKSVLFAYNSTATCAIIQNLIGPQQPKCIGRHMW